MKLAKINLKKTTIALAVIGLIVYGAVWLWQRQPKGGEQTAPAASQKTDEKLQEEFLITPTDGTVLSSKNINFDGKTHPGSRILIFSNDFQTVAKTADSGNFQQGVTLSDGLNQVDIIVLSDDLGQTLKKSLNLYVTAERSLGNQVLASTVRAILDNVITIAYLGSEKTILVSKSTQLDLPKDVLDEETSTASATANIRVGDFIIALGDPKDKETLSAKYVQIIRTSKPQNNIQFVVAKILTVPKQNSFSVKNNSDSKIIELTLTKNSQVSQDDKVGSVADIAKEKTAIIFYHADTNKKLIDSIYLLPLR